MKFAFLAATALALSVPALAQDTTTPPAAEPDTMQTQDGTMAQDPATQAAPPTNTPPSDPAMQTPPAADPAMAPPPAADPAMQAAPATPGGTMTDGGYAPSAPPMSGAAQPGAQVMFKPSVPVAQAFPPPPPKEEYPVCRGAVQDGCRNPGNK